MDEIKYANKQIVIYARVSSTNQENEGTIETQLTAIYEYAKNHGFTIIQKYLDNGWSGDSIIRPELDRLRVDAKKKIWNTVLIYDPDRLARRYSYQELVMDELREAGIEVLFVTTPTPSNGVEKILYGVQGLFAEYERAKITERFRLGKVRKANEGHVIASEAPYGYTFIPKLGKRGDDNFRQGFYQINEYEAAVVKQIFSWVAENGLTIRALVKKLQENNILPRKSKRGVWNTSTLSNLLRNKTYIGEGHFGATYAIAPINPIKKDGYRKIKKTSRRSKPEEEWIKIPTPKIINDDLFFQVQTRLKANFETAKRNTKNEYLLTSKIWCSCNKRRTGEGALQGKHLYYRCTNRISNFPLPLTCIEKGINAKVADYEVWKHITKLMSSPKLLMKQLERRTIENQNRAQDSITNVEPVKKEIDKLKEQEDRFTKAYAAGIISIEQLKEFIQPLRSKKESLIEQLKRHEIKEKTPKRMLLPNINQLEEFTTKAEKNLENLSFESKKEIIKNIVEKIVATPKELLIYGHLPIESLNNVPFCSNYRYGANTNTQIENESSMPFELKISLENDRHKVKNEIKKLAPHANTSLL
jgi:site-specific DNA recombinase